VVEYVLPQLLLAWLMKQSDYDGIRYFSTRQGARPLNLLGMNFVIPARRSAPKGLCTRLCELFEATPPISWQLSKVVPPLASGAKRAPNASMDSSRAGFGLWEVSTLRVH